jgi:methylmalonyl-CoA/ethylmalonyl-CoA epimerase
VSAADAVVFDHIAIAAERWTDLWPRFAAQLGGAWVGGGQGIGFSPMQLRFANGMKVELLEPNEVEKNDFLRRFLDRHGAGPHHLTFKVPDIERWLALAKDAGFPPINVDLRDPHWQEGFIHPHHVGVVVQLAQALEEWERPPPPGLPEPAGRRASFDRVSHAVASIDEARRLFVGVLGAHDVAAGEDEAARWVELAWPGPGRLRLLEPASPSSPIAAWLGARPGRIHHLAFTGGAPVGDGQTLADGTVHVAPTGVEGTRLLITPA